jgi:uncharacterized protein YqgC (DUF456 family)
MHLDWSQLAAFLGHGVGYLTVLLLCLCGLVLSALTFSGTWLVFAATVLAAWLRAPHFPGLATILIFLVLCVSIEIAEWLAGAWGVQRRGGSMLAGLAALVGGLIGLLLGTLIPVFILGPLLGMFAGSFGLAYLVERSRLKRHDAALHIATGAILARAAMLMVKVTATLGMIVILLLGMLLA